MGVAQASVLSHSLGSPGETIRSFDFWIEQGTVKEKYSLGLNWHLTSVWGIFNKTEWILFFFQLGRYSVNTKSFNTLNFFFFSVFLFSSNQRSSFHYSVEEKDRFEYPSGWWFWYYKLPNRWRKKASSPSRPRTKSVSCATSPSGLLQRESSEKAAQCPQLGTQQCRLNNSSAFFSFSTNET